jgi:hypothetical protein
LLNVATDGRLAYGDQLANPDPPLLAETQTPTTALPDRHWTVPVIVTLALAGAAVATANPHATSRALSTAAVFLFTAFMAFLTVRVLCKSTF